MKESTKKHHPLRRKTIQNIFPHQNEIVNVERLKSLRESVKFMNVFTVTAVLNVCPSPQQKPLLTLTFH